MATSSALNTSNSNIKFKISIVQNGQSVSNNTSNVTVKVNVYRTNTGYTTYGTGTVNCKIDGVTYKANITPDDKITSSGIVLFSKTLNVDHNNDGTKTLKVSVSINHQQFTASEQSFSLKLKTIPRASSISFKSDSATLGSGLTIAIARASTTFTHTLTYSFAGATGTIGTNITLEKIWTVPLSLASKIPNTTSGILTVTCTTYNGSTKIGTTSKTIQAKLPASVVPTIGTVKITEGDTTVASKFTAFIQDKSKLSVDISASGAYGSTIKSYSTKILNKIYSGKTFVSGVVSTSGSVSVAITVTDSRGRKATTTKTVTVVPYHSPMIERFDAVRCNADGSDNIEGDHVRLDYSFTIAPVNNTNAKNYKIEYKLRGGTTYTALTSGSEYAVNKTLVPSQVFNGDNSYDFKLTVTDALKSVAHITEISTAFTLTDVHRNGTGYAIGKVAENENLLDVALPALFRNGLEVENDWVNLTLNSDIFEIYNTSSTPRFKASAGFVNVIGTVKPKAPINGGTSIITIASGIPEKYRPPITINFLCQGTGMNRWLCQVTSGGEITFSRYGNSGAYQTCEVGNWLPFIITYATA